MQALDVLEDVTVQSQTVLKKIENETELRRAERYDKRDGAPNFQLQNRSLNAKRLAYYATHLECLRLTLAVLLQTLYTAQSIMWSK
jgi:hypothetical protein